jgi:TnpA family transposase
MLKRLAMYPRQIAVTLRELGCIERTLFALSWMRDIDLQRRVGLGLNKGEARNALARAVFFRRLGELRDRSFESQAYRASGLNLLVAAIVPWNKKYLEDTLDALRSEGHRVPKESARHLAPLGWEYVSLTLNAVTSGHSAAHHPYSPPSSSSVNV